MAMSGDWTILEKLILTQAVYKYGENMWFQVARILKQHGLIQPHQRQQDFFSQKNCQHQYYLLVENLQVEKHRQNELKNDMPVVARIARQLYTQRVEEVKENLRKDEEEFARLAKEIALIKSGQWDDKLREDVSDTSKDTQLDTPSDDVLEYSQQKMDTLEDQETLTSEIHELSKPTAPAEIIKPETQPAPIESAELEEPKPEITEITNAVEPTESVETEKTIESKTLPEPTDPSEPIQPKESTPTLDSREPLEPAKVIEPLESTEQLKPANVIEPSESKEPLEAVLQSEPIEQILPSEPVESMVRAESVEAIAQTVLQSDPIEPIQPNELINKPLNHTLMEEAGIKRTSSETTILPEHATKRFRLEKHNSDIQEDNEDQVLSTAIALAPNQMSVSTLISTTDETMDEIDFSDKNNDYQIETPMEKTNKMDILSITNTYESPTPFTPSINDISSLVNPVIETNDTTMSESIYSTVIDDKEPIADKVTPKIIIPEVTSSHPRHEPNSPFSRLAPEEEDFTGSETATPTSTCKRLHINTDQRQKAWQKNINLLWQEIANHKNGTMFMNPIKKSYAPLYDQVVKQPLYLKTIKNRVRDGVVKTTAEFERDVVLMLTNSLMYNKEGTEMYTMAMEMLDDFREQIRLFKSADGFNSASLWENGSEASN